MLYLKSIYFIEEEVAVVEFLVNGSEDYWTGGHEYACRNWEITE